MVGHDVPFGADYMGKVVLLFNNQEHRKLGVLYRVARRLHVYPYPRTHSAQDMIRSTCPLNLCEVFKRCHALDDDFLCFFHLPERVCGSGVFSFA